MSDEDRIKRIISVLYKKYPRPSTALRFGNAFELLVSTILSAQCTDERVNRVTPALFRKYKDARAFSGAKRKQLEKEIRSTGFYRNKAKNIIDASGIIVDEFKGKVPDTMEGLLRLPGVARKTANIVLSGAFGKAEGIAVDTHVKRLAGRLALSGESDPVKIEKDLTAKVPRRHWIDFNYLLVNHGRHVCVARKPRCQLCPLKKYCPSAGLA